MSEQGDFDMDAAVGTIAEGLGLDVEPQETQEIDGTPDAPETPEPMEETPADQPVVRAPPKSWAKETHELWGKLPPEAQTQVELREKQMLEGLEQYKGDSGLGRQMRETITPYKALLSSQGVDEQKAVSVLLNAHYKLSTLPVDQRTSYFASLASTYGIDLSGIQPQQQQQIDPAVKAAHDRLARLEGALTEREQRQYEEARSKTEREVGEFAAANPYFDEVANETVALIQAGMNLQDAYERAVWANPVTRAKEQARLHTEAQAKLRGKSKQEADAALKARGANVKSHDTRKAPTEPLGKMDDTLKETLAEIRSRTH